ncbi:MAG: glutamate synthase [Firmicutes bacterium]|nr:glutamate synthase [Bacillota bacterium]
MMIIDAKELDFKAINEQIRSASSDCLITGCCGQRFIAAGMGDRCISIEGVPGNALGAYLNGASITVRANAQDAVGDTMNEGEIIVNGSIGDAAGYAMRGGRIFVRGNAGYRAGIHMKAYKDKSPLMIIGGRAGSFLGEYQAGGTIIVLNLAEPGKRIVGAFPCTGMHGGKMILRGECCGIDFSPQVTAKAATERELEEIRNDLTDYCRIFDIDIDEVMSSPFTVVRPDSKNPYREMYVAN